MGIMIMQGDRVTHKNQGASFGVGTVLSVNENAGTALVEWDTHEVKRSNAKLTTRHSHVHLKSLIRVSTTET